MSDYAKQRQADRLQRGIKMWLELAAMNPSRHELSAQLVEKLQATPLYAWQRVAVGNGIPVAIRMVALGYLMGYSAPRRIFPPPGTSPED